MFSANKYLEDSLNKRRDDGSFRSLNLHNDLIDFCSNDYLGFSSTGELRAKILEFNQKQPRHVFEGSTGVGDVGFTEVASDSTGDASEGALSSSELESVVDKVSS